MIDWSHCPAVEKTEGKVSGAWVLKGTRVIMEVRIDNSLSKWMSGRRARISLARAWRAAAGETPALPAGRRTRISLAGVRRGSAAVLHPTTT